MRASKRNTTLSVADVVTRGTMAFDVAPGTNSVRITGGYASSSAVRADGVRTAMRPATQHAIQQITAGVPR